MIVQSQRPAKLRCALWRRGRVVRQRPAKPRTAVRVRSSPSWSGQANCRGRLGPPVAGNGESVGTAVLGGGPAGLTAAYVLALRGRARRRLRGRRTVGGIAKTVEFDGYRFDLGGHRFFTKLAPVERLWEEMLGEEFLARPRLSRIYYDGVLRLPAPGAEDVARAARRRRVGALRALLLRCTAAPPAASRDVRGLGDRALRPAPLRRVLPLVHREGLGHPGLARSAPSGPRSGSRTSRSPRRCCHRSACAAARRRR